MVTGASTDVRTFQLMPTTTPIGLNLNTMCQIMFDNVALSRYWTFSGGYGGGGGGGNFNPGTCTCNTGKTKYRSRMHILYSSTVMTYTT